MTALNVLPFTRPTQSAALEEALIGALLALPDKLELLESMGLAREDLTVARLNVALMVIRRMAERRLEVTALTVASAGKRSGWLSDGDAEWLVGLEMASTLTRERALQIAEDIRVLARARLVRGQLQGLVELIDRGRFHPAAVTGPLTEILQGLATDFSADETADADLLTLNATWDENVARGKATLDPTGIRLLDDIIGGTPENLWFIHGKPGIGKNALLSSIIKAQLQRGEERTGVFLLEDGVDGLLRRWQAEGLGIPLRDVGWKKLTPEQQEQKTHLDAGLYTLLQRVDAYRHDTISRAELHRRAMRMIYRGKVRRIFIDNMKEIDHRDIRARQEHWQQIGETTRIMRNLAKQTGVPICILIHDTEDTARDGKEGAPDPRKMSGGQAGGDRARLVLGVWRKGQSLRVTVTKGNEVSAAGLRGPTVELKQNYEAGTVDANGGRLVDLANEDAKERREQKSNRREEAVDEQLERAKLKKQKAALAANEAPKPSKAPEPPPQAVLLEIPTSLKPGTQ